MKHGNHYECPICSKKVLSRCHSVVIDRIVDTVIQREDKLKQFRFNERYDFAKLFLRDSPTVYGTVVVANLPYGLSPWTDSEKREVAKLLSLVSETERQNWFVALGITKYDIIRSSLTDILNTLDNLQIPFSRDDDLKVLLARIFSFINK